MKRIQIAFPPRKFKPYKYERKPTSKRAFCLPMNIDIIHRICETGPVYASLQELITAIVGDPETARVILSKYPTILEMAGAHAQELQELPGIGQATATRFKAAFELGRRLSIATPKDRIVVRSPADAANRLISEMGMLEQEELRVILLDTRNNLIATQTVYKGSLNASIIRTAEVFREAIRRNAAAIIVAHNHPSGDPNPSPDDISVTRDIISAGELLDIEVLDHCIAQPVLRRKGVEIN
jgi:DNA repair protein RadC